MRIFNTSAAEQAVEWNDQYGVMQPIDGCAEGKNLLSMRQLSTDDIYDYIAEAYAAEAVLNSPDRGIDLLPRRVLKAVMRQPSTRTGGSMTSAMYALGGSADLLSGMGTSAEAKGESYADSSVALATEAQILGIRTAENYGPMMAAEAIAIAIANVTRSGREWPAVPVINLGDGENEHPTQALGDLFTIDRRLGELRGKKIAIVGDHEKYRANHSLMIGAKAVGMEIIAVESEAAPVPDRYVVEAGDSLVLRTHDLDEAMQQADVLYMGRNPGEYTGNSDADKKRYNQLVKDYECWVVDSDRIQLMKPDSIVMHPRPRLKELHPSVDSDPRAADVEQMLNMKPMRMAIIARHLGFSIRQAMLENGTLQDLAALDGQFANR